MIHASIIGATGYTGIELVRLLNSHPQVILEDVYTESYVGEEIASVYPHLKNCVTLVGEKFDVQNLNTTSQVFFIALPHGKSKEIVPFLLQAGKKIIDLGADYRLNKVQTYANWYPDTPPLQELLNSAVYGLPEIGKRNSIAQTHLVANPGCYPTASLLAAYPLLKENYVETRDIIFNAMSGVSGAGRGLSLKTHFCEMSHNAYAYNIAGMHRHTPEIEQELAIISHATNMVVQFTPHIIPTIRGMLVTSYFKLKNPRALEEILSLFIETYSCENFIRIMPINTLPQVKNVLGTNYCDIGVSLDARTNKVLVVSAMDNLIKGAAGQAMQNMNIMFALPEALGFQNRVAMYP